MRPFSADVEDLLESAGVGTLCPGKARHASRILAGDVAVELSLGIGREEFRRGLSPINSIFVSVMNARALAR